jgi:hypothetical protein
MMIDWRLWLYPEFRDVPEYHRDRIWHLAREESFSAGESMLMLAGVVAAAFMVRYAKFRSFTWKCVSRIYR